MPSCCFEKVTYLLVNCYQTRRPLPPVFWNHRVQCSRHPDHPGTAWQPSSWPHGSSEERTQPHIYSLNTEHLPCLRHRPGLWGNVGNKTTSLLSSPSWSLCESKGERQEGGEVINSQHQTKGKEMINGEVYEISLPNFPDLCSLAGLCSGGYCQMSLRKDMGADGKCSEAWPSWTVSLLGIA